MNNTPDFININSTSLASKEPYKPPSGAFFGAQQPASKRPRKVPGGDWSEDPDPVPVQTQVPVSAPSVFQPTFSLDVEEKPTPVVKPEEPRSKFNFINKNSANKQPVRPDELPKNGVLSLDEIKRDV